MTKFILIEVKVKMQFVFNSQDEFPTKELIEKKLLNINDRLVDYNYDVKRVSLSE